MASPILQKGDFCKTENLFKFWKQSMLYTEFLSGDKAGNKKLVFSLKANEYKCETTGLAEPENCEDFIHLPGRF